VDLVPLFVSLEPVGVEVDLRPALALLATRDLELDAAELRAGLRRSMLLLAAGGDPRRELELDGRAVSSFAAEVDRPQLREALAGGLDALAPKAAPFPNVAAAVAELRRDPELAIRAWACALLAEALDEEPA